MSNLNNFTGTTHPIKMHGNCPPHTFQKITHFAPGEFPGAYSLSFLNIDILMQFY